MRGNRPGLKPRHYIPVLCALVFSSVATAATPQLPPALALAGYQAAMTNMHKPPNVIFEYTETRSGPTRVIAEIHRVYRDQAGDERNDTIAVNGSLVAPPITHVYRGRAWPYDADKFAALPADYDLTLNGMSLVAGKIAYGFAAKRKTLADFSIETLFLAVDSGLPVRELFTVSGPTCSGHGTIDFGAYASYWLPVSVAVVCSAPRPSAVAASPEAKGAGPLASPSYRETLKFSNYTFPARMPQEIFHL